MVEKLEKIESTKSIDSWGLDGEEEDYEHLFEEMTLLKKQSMA